ncbi:MAG: hypothetical protein K6G69_07280 [Lachnospiraceae bacterium]|nr:hypothetical protein [Lachnospiraceae bacterium]
MKNVKTGTICSIISMTSVVIMFIWGFLANDFSHSWLAVMIGGIVSYGFYMVRRDIEKSEKEEEKPSDE